MPYHANYHKIHSILRRSSVVSCSIILFVISFLSIVHQWYILFCFCTKNVFVQLFETEHIPNYLCSRVFPNLFTSSIALSLPIIPATYFLIKIYWRILAHKVKVCLSMCLNLGCATSATCAS